MTHKLRWLRWLGLIILALLIIGCAAILAWWQYYKATPAYSLALLVDASQRNDAAAFDRVVDIEKVFENFVPQLAQKATGGLGPNLVTSLRTQLQTVAPGVTASVEEIVKEEIRKRIKDLAGSGGELPFFITAIAIPFKANISESNDKAKVTMAAKQQVELFMERSEDGRWKVVSVRDDALAARIVNEIVKDLPASGSQLDQEMRKQLRNLPGALRDLPLVP